MHNVHPLHPPRDATDLQTGLIKGGEADAYTVQTKDGVVAARPAVSCLVQPHTDDLVLLTRQVNRYFIIAVLERQGNAINMNVPGDLRIRAHGQLAIESEHQLKLSAAQDIQLTGLSVNLVAGLAFLTAQTLKLQAPRVEADHDEVEFRTRRLSSWTQQVYQRADSVMRWVETVETANIGQWVQNVRQAYMLHAQHAVVTARGDVRIDGERIHMG